MLYRTIATDERVAGVEPEIVTRWLWRAKRRMKRLESFRRVDFYRYEIHQRTDGKWEVVAMQNIAEPIHANNSQS